MQIKSNNVEDYINQIPEEKKNALISLRKCIIDNIPEGFKETIEYGMIAYVVPHELYPKGYHCNTKMSLPFISIAAQKNFISLYHMGLYIDEKLLQWFLSEYSLRIKTKIDMGKSCIRFKKTEQIPFELISELVKKITPQQWIETYERKIKPK